MIKVKITKEAHQKLRYFTELCHTEISGLGKVKEMPGFLEIYDIEIFEQRVSGAHSNLDPDVLAMFLHEKFVAGESVKDYKVWWHSHVNMEAYFSPTDISTIEMSSEFPYLVSIVTNKRGEDRARIDMYEPLRVTLPVELELTLEEDKKLKEICQLEIIEKVRKQWPILISKGKKRYSIRKSSKKASQ